ncbi:MAG: ABC-type transport auxiliary lipoprotein family protein [Planctomycetota bacterium]
MVHRRGRVVALSLTLWLSTSSCSLSRDYPIKHLYGLDVERPASDTATPVDAVYLRVAHFRASPGCDSVALVYRRSEQEYAADFYHEFFRPPAQLVEQETREWLSRTQRFSSVLPAGSHVMTPWTLEGHIGAIYGDFRAANAPHAVLELTLLLLRERDGELTIERQREYRESEPIPAATPEAVVAGLRLALARILTRFEADLAGA